MPPSTSEYLSVSTQRDTERALIGQEADELRSMPEDELAELARLLEAKGLSPDTLLAAAAELTEHDVLAAHLDVELGIDRAEVANPVDGCDGVRRRLHPVRALPLLAILLPPTSDRIMVTFGSVIVALAATGALSADSVARRCVRRSPGW